jgi:hypothetical protein
MFRSSVFCFLVFIVLTIKVKGQFGNEWINENNVIFKVTIKEKGIYRLGYNELKIAGFPVETSKPKTFQLLHHGTQVPIYIFGEEDNVFDGQDYIEFYAEGNNGEQDSLLYRPYNSRMNKYHSLFSDESAYFLTFGETPIRTEILPSKAFNSELIEKFHLEQQIRVFADQYSFNNSIGFPPFVMQSYFEEGEGWTGKIVVADTVAKFPIKMLNYLPQSDLPPILECLVNGRTEVTHDVNISIENVDGTNRSIGKIDYFGFVPLKLQTHIRPEEISSAGQVLLRTKSSKKERTEWHSMTYHKLTYPQAFDMSGLQSKYFYLNPSTQTNRYLLINNASQNSTAYTIKNRYSFQKIPNQLIDNKLGLAIATVPSVQTTIFVSSDIKKPLAIEKVNLNLEYKVDANYLIITHPNLRLSANEYAKYRASEEGGKFKTNVIEIQDLYLNFAFGERTPLAIRRFIDFKLSNGHKIDNLLLIGRGKSFPDQLKTDVTSDMVPTFGYPGSDILLTAGLQGFDIDVQAVPTGRLSVISNREVLNYLQKLKEYEANTEDVLWKKNLLHLSGGGSKTEISYFRGILESIEPKVADSYLAGKVEALSKVTDATVENIDISSKVNNGLGMITFFGHSSSTATDLNIGNASSPSSKLQNKGKYPLMYFNGCGVGNVFNRYDLLTSDWLITPNVGAVAVFANSFWSYDTPTNRYIHNLYEKLFQDKETIGLSIGEIQQAVNRKIKTEGADQLMLSNIHQLVLQGDPALRIFSLKKPDLKMERIFIRSAKEGLPISANDSVSVGIVVSNLGRYEKNTNFKVSLLAIEGQKALQKIAIIPAVAHRDTIILNLKKDLNISEITATLDFDNKVEEFNEKNNFGILKINWSEASPYASFPPDIVVDKLGPLLDVYFDDVKLRNKDFVDSKALIKIILSDENPLFSKDTSGISLYLQACESCRLIKVPAASITQIQVTPNTVEAQFVLPNLPKGRYSLFAVGKDSHQNTSGNGYSITFQISEGFQPTKLRIYPNPAETFANLEFQVISSSKPIEGVVYLYDSFGRLIEKVIFSPKIGKNDLFINQNGKLPAGIYVFKALINWSDGNVETLEGKIIIK